LFDDIKGTERLAKYPYRSLNFNPIFIPLFEGKVSGVSVQDKLLRLPFLTPETNFAEQKGLESKIYVHQVTGAFSTH